MFEITAEDVAELGDSALREFIAKLCEASVTKAGLPATSVTWGGPQTAADGGIDVRVELSQPHLQVIPRSAIGIQVKKTGIGPAAIRSEMEPEGSARPSIVDLAERGGAYVIATSDSIADRGVQERKRAMRALADRIPSGSFLLVDFFDARRLATWANSHTSVAAWLRERIGRPLVGWQPHGEWTARLGTADHYIVDNHLRLVEINGSAAPSDALSGIERLRAIAAQPKSSIRLTGLSGVGKTRFVQAIFDDTIGQNSIAPTFAVYADLADNPSPDPTALAAELVARRERAVLVVDNCGSDLHRRLSELCSKTESALSVITVEYDIREDQPEGTNSFRLEPASEELVFKLLRAKFPSLSQVDAHRLATFSGGNSRVGIVLAQTVADGESVSGLSDDGLFRRLFNQRKTEDSSLMAVAEACSLVYSFDISDVTTDQSELKRLAILASCDALSAYRCVAELRTRNLVQARSQWRAVLPHAIANRLAKNALQNLPESIILSTIATATEPRLLRSFARRLGYLHDSIIATKIIKAWLSPGGLLDDLSNLAPLQRSVLISAAPAAPNEILNAIFKTCEGPSASRFIASAISSSTTLVRLVRSLAYEELSFPKALEVLIKFAELPDAKDARENVNALFQPYLSGTRASPALRVASLRALCLSRESARRELGLTALRAALEAFHFSSSHDFDFGSRKRDFGYAPSSRQEIASWYSGFIDLAVSLIEEDNDLASRIRHILADSFRGVWSHAYAALEAAAGKITQGGYWEEGWIAARTTIRLDAEQMPREARKRLAKLEVKLRPKDLEEEIRAIVLARSYGSLDLADGDPDADETEPGGGYVQAIGRLNHRATELGQHLASDEALFSRLAPQLVIGEPARLVQLGEGLALSAARPRTIWEKLISAISTAPVGQRNGGALLGFVLGIRQRSPELSEELLDEVLTHSVLGQWFPDFQASAGLDEKAIARVKRSIELGIAPIQSFERLAYGRATRAVSHRDLADILQLISTKPQGRQIAIDILQLTMHVHSSEQHENQFELVRIGRTLLKDWTFDGERGRHSDSYKVGTLAEACIRAPGTARLARSLAHKLATAISNYRVSPHDYERLLRAIFLHHPRVALDTFLLGNSATRQKRRRLTRLRWLEAKHLKDISPQDLIAWCDLDPDIRYSVAAESIPLFDRTTADHPLQWSELAIQLLSHAPNALAVVSEFADRVLPTSGWTGERIKFSYERLQLFEEFQVHEDQTVAEFATARAKQLRSELAEELSILESQRNVRDQRFEFEDD